jgi:hypothetical protein
VRLAVIWQIRGPHRAIPQRPGDAAGSPDRELTADRLLVQD